MASYIHGELNFGDLKILWPHDETPEKFELVGRNIIINGAYLWRLDCNNLSAIYGVCRFYAYFLNKTIGIMRLDLNTNTINVACAFRPCCKNLGAIIFEDEVYFKCRHILITRFGRILVAPDEDITVGFNMYIIKKNHIHTIYNIETNKLLMTRRNVLGITGKNKILVHNYNEVVELDCDLSAYSRPM